jgi:hypothetical protein
MNPLGDLRNALRGWSEIAAGRSDAARLFRTDASGLTAALVTFLAALLVSVAAQSVVWGLPSLAQVFLGLVAQAITVALLALAINWALRFLKSPEPMLILLVPIVYAMAGLLVVAVPLQWINSSLGLVAIPVLGGLIWRAAGVLAGLKSAQSAALAGLCVILLVVVPAALYMLLTLIPS